MNLRLINGFRAVVVTQLTKIDRVENDADLNSGREAGTINRIFQGVFHSRG